MNNILRIRKLKTLNCKAHNILTLDINGFSLCDIRAEINDSFARIKDITNSGYCKGYQAHLGLENHLKTYQKFIKMQNSFLSKLSKINKQRKQFRINSKSKQFTIFN